MRGIFFLLLFCSFSATAFTQDPSLSDCYETFFTTATKVKNTNTIKLLVGKKEQTLSTYLKTNVQGLDQRLGLKDLDGDGKNELVIYNFTGGAHCCDEFYFFKNTGPNRFAPAAKLFAGSTCVNGTTFLYDFAEPFGYFYTCFACELDEKKNSKGEKYERLANISLTYRDGKLQVSPGDAALKEKVLRNLRYIKSLGWDGGAKGDEFDDGRRKALAQTLAVYYFSFGKNKTETKKVFSTYYSFRDAATVWKDFSVLLANVQSQNSF
jgi:hypothetical protein